MERRRESVSWGSVIIFVRMDDPEIACLVTCTLATQAGVPRGSMVMRLCRVNIFGSRFLLDCRFCRFRDYEMNEPSSAFFLLIFLYPAGFHREQKIERSNQVPLYLWNKIKF